jgi:predicted AlkP superfamily phosphohydrolase/phosphomutase
MNEKDHQLERKVAVIGLDGMSWPLLNKLLEDDAMPTLQSVLDKAVKGILKSTIPPLTPPAWTSIATGVNPGKHGVFDFTILSENYQTRIVSSLDVKYPRIHEMVALKGLKSVCVNHPLTYPIVKMDNIHVISDWVSPGLHCYPPFLEHYLKMYPTYALEHALSGKLSVLFEESKGRVSVVNALMEKIDWNLFWVIYSETDHVFHKYFRQIFQGNSEVKKLFRKLDESLEKALEIADLTIIVSDHGFEEYNYTINLNCYLNELGFVYPIWKKSVKEFGDFIPTVEERAIGIPRFLHNLFLETSFLKATVKKLYRIFTGKKLVAKCPYVDPKNSKAFLVSRSGVYVTKEDIIDDIVRHLVDLECIKNAWRREEFYQGPHIGKAPPIIVNPNFDGGFTLAGTARIAPKLISKGTVFDHHPDGIFIAFGRNISPGQIKELRTVDVVPTILHYLDLSLPNDTDGIIIQQTFPSPKNVKYYNYLKHWQLISKVQFAKSKLAKL